MVMKMEIGSTVLRVLSPNKCETVCLKFETHFVRSALDRSDFDKLSSQPDFPFQLPRRLSVKRDNKPGRNALKITQNSKPIVDIVASSSRLFLTRRNAQCCLQ